MTGHSWACAAFWTLLVGGAALIWIGTRKPRPKGWRPTHDWRNDGQWRRFM